MLSLLLSLSQLFVPRAYKFLLLAETANWTVKLPLQICLLYIMILKMCALERNLINAVLPACLLQVSG